MDQNAAFVTARIAEIGESLPELEELTPEVTPGLSVLPATRNSHGMVLETR
jgi:hypothetical protein